MLVVLAEWSKAVALGAILFGGVGSNPTVDNLDFFAHTIWISILTTSSPMRCLLLPAGIFGSRGAPGPRRLTYTAPARGPFMQFPVAGLGHTNLILCFSLAQPTEN